MVQTKHIAVVCLAVSLSGCGSAALEGIASTTSSDSSSTQPTVSITQSDTPAKKAAIEPRGRAYLFRGIAGLIYSRGMDELVRRISRAGVQVSVDTYLMWRAVANQAIRDYRRDPEPITLIGHSMGGDSTVAFAAYLNAADIPVSLLVTCDPSRFAGYVPPNVRYINIYQSLSVMGGGDIVSGGGFHGHYASINLSDHGEIIHINIEKADTIQEQLVSKIRALAATPARLEGEVVPLRIVIPAAVSIKLWDSAMPVSARAGDTLQTLAGTYRVPVWALAQLNQIPEDQVLTQGERVIVPRYLSPTAAPSSASSYGPTGR
jgi:hypothetical protein